MKTSFNREFISFWDSETKASFLPSLFKDISIPLIADKNFNTVVLESAILDASSI